MYSIRKIIETTSTNTDAQAAAESGEAEGLVIWALKQTGGRGRHGRVWESPEGNLYASILLRPNCSPQSAGAYGFIAALAVHDVVKDLARKTTVTLKWPNDVLADGKKISGILLDAAPVQNGLIAWLVVGIGINLQHFPEDALYPATSLRALGVTIDVEAALNKLLIGFARWKKKFETEGFPAIRAAWLEHAQKGQMSVKLADETVSGEFSDIDENGNLVLQMEDGSGKTLAAGDVFFA